MHYFFLVSTIGKGIDSGLYFTAAAHVFENSELVDQKKIIHRGFVIVTIS